MQINQTKLKLKKPKATNSKPTKKQHKQKLYSLKTIRKETVNLRKVRQQTLQEREQLILQRRTREDVKWFSKV